MDTVVLDLGGQTAYCRDRGGEFVSMGVSQSMVFPAAGGQDWEPSEAQLTDWQEAYPGVDVEAELKKARVWVLANPSRRKTCRGMPRFVVNWLTRAEADRLAHQPKQGRVMDRWLENNRAALGARKR